MRTTLSALIAGVFVFIVGCPMNVQLPPEAVLAGNWMATTADGTAFAATFNANGKLEQITGTRDDGQGVTLDVAGATSSVTGSDFEIRITTDEGEVIFSGTISADGRTLVGTLSNDITLDDALVIVIPGGDLSLDAETAEEGNANTNDNGMDDDNGNDNSTDNENANAGDDMNDNSMGDDGDNENENGNINANANANDNATGNGNDNGTEDGNENANSNDNENSADGDTGNDNSTGNENANGNTNANVNDNGTGNDNTNSNTNDNGTELP